MMALVVSELERIWSRSKTKFLFVLVVLSTLCISLFLKTMGIGFYTQEATATLNSLNFSVFALREIHLLLSLVVLPILFVDCLNAEYATGSLRLVMLRPYHKFEFFLGKWIALALTVSIFLLAIFVSNTLLGYLLLPSVSGTVFYHIDKIYTPFAAFLYSIRFYFWEWILCISLLSIGSAVCSLIPNAVVSIAAILGVVIGALYLSKDTFYFFIKSTEYIFYVLSGRVSPTSFIILFAVMISGFILSLILWQKRDFFY
ncbi:ABC transporter permease [Thermotalea metallivorans]|uniref:Uncharacterized protein n=1 Tax=Thermotalea metallivorans TaxID=520762 RepID=A0A140L6X2_9FIRM|nr:ABC transporter permease [Thermotalea metallivorans]KXG76297.1 hypothetical protein AN619_12540 [Thermotalea metallivorans]